MFRRRDERGGAVVGGGNPILDRLRGPGPRNPFLTDSHNGPDQRGKVKNPQRVSWPKNHVDDKKASSSTTYRCPLDQDPYRSLERRAAEGRDRPRFVTVVLPSVVNPSGRRARLSAVADTWGPAARAVFVVRDHETEPTAPLVTDGRADFPQRIVLDGNESKDKDDGEDENGVLRLRDVLCAAIAHVDPDFVFLVNDHTYVIPERLEKFLADRSPDEPLYAGRALADNNGLAFNSGAAGYALSRRTLTDLVRRLDDHDDHSAGAYKKDPCDVSATTKWLRNNPGLLTATCLRDALRTTPVDTRDGRGEHLFHAYGIVRTVRGAYDGWYANKHANLSDHEGFSPDYAVLRSGPECCSVRTITFHYVEHAETRALFRTLRTLREDPSLRNGDDGDDKLRKLVRSAWPNNGDKGWIGGYSAPLPKDDDEETWTSLVAVLRKLSLPSSRPNERLAPSTLTVAAAKHERRR